MHRPAAAKAAVKTPKQSGVFAPTGRFGLQGAPASGQAPGPSAAQPQPPRHKPAPTAPTATTPPGFAASRAPDQPRITQSRGRLGRPAPVSTNPYNHLHLTTGATAQAAPHSDSQGRAN